MSMTDELRPTPSPEEHLASFDLGPAPHLSDERRTRGEAETDRIVRWYRQQGEREEAEALAAFEAIGPTDEEWDAMDVEDPPGPRREREQASADQERQRRGALHAEDLHVRELGRTLYQAAKATTLELPPRRTLREFLAETSEPRQWRVEGLLPVGGNGLLVAKAKSGKSTLVSNLIRSCVDGDPFLDRYRVRPAGGLVTLIDFELPEDTLRDWLREQGVRDLDAMEPVSLKGRAGSFDIRDDATRARWARQLDGTEVCIVDALSPLLGALRLAEATEAGDLLPFLDALKAEAGIGELVVVHHMGHVAERARGDSRLEGWPDAIWALNADDDGTRYLSARGRDVDLRETALTFDPSHKRLTIEQGAGSRRDAEVEEALAAIVSALRVGGEPLSGRQVEKAIDEEHPRAAVRLALEEGVRSGVLLKTAGFRNAYLYSPGPAS